MPSHAISRDFVYTAGFGPTDEAAIVLASLACPCCLSSSTNWTLNLVPWDEGLVCSCQGCGHRWSVDVDAGQALRLALDPTITGDPGRREITNPVAFQRFE
ncbi:MAG: hypothetical protein QOG62_1252 [Thermoleophilaceae bacterium]|jgi:hypothetical protein|nr:hypothetical protein [Thermoleophilaceae bacterium]